MKTILIIEDQPDMRKNIVTILRMEAYAVLSASNGRDGLTLAREEKPDLILCDVMMPDLDGYAVLQGLRADRTVAGTPFIFLTAKGEKRDMRTGMNLGADDYLIKPVTASDLLAAIAARLSREQVRPITASAPDFTRTAPLEALGLTPREAEVVLWVAQGKSNGEVALILDMAEGTVKKHLQHIFEKLGIESRHALTVQAHEVLQG
jgi:DNA-binding NarL/FixJ family response regulator